MDDEIFKTHRIYYAQAECFNISPLIMANKMNHENNHMGEGRFGERPRRIADAAKPLGKVRGGRGARDGEGLTGRQARFVAIFLADPKINAKGAARAAGFACPEQAAHRLLRAASVKAAIARRLQPQMARLELTAEKVLQGLAQIAFGNMMDFGTVTEDGGFKVDLCAMDRASAGAIQSITSTTREELIDGRRVERTTTTIKLADRRPALEALAKYFKLIGNDRDEGEHETIQLVIMGAPERLSPSAIEDADTGLMR